MKRRGGRARICILVVACGATFWGCRDVGLADRNLPVQQARHRAFRYSVYQPTTNNPPLAHGGRHWTRSFPVEAIPGRLLVQVANVEGTLLYARRGEQAPYSRLYSPVSQDRWIPYLRLN